MSTEFKTKINEILGHVPTNDIIEIGWVTGGIDGGNCWNDDGHFAMDSEPEPAFKELDKILEGLFPNITFLQYKKLERELIKTDSNTSYGYYGNSTNYASKSVNLSDLEIFLIKEKIWIP